MAMNEPPTLLIRETDDDRTLIDPIRLRDPDPPFAGSGRTAPTAKPISSLDGLGGRLLSRWPRLRPRESGPGRRTIDSAVLLGLVLGLGSLAYQQSLTAGALREAIIAMKTRPPVPLVNDPVAAGARTSAPVVAEPRSETSTRGVDARDREELELRGANLIGSNDFVGALVHYQALMELFPAEAAFRDVVAALRSKLRCASHEDPSSHACL